MKVIDRIYQYIDHLDVSVRVFEETAGIGNGYLAKMKRSGGSVGSELVSKMVMAYPLLSLDWLICGTGEMLKKNSGGSLIQKLPKTIPLVSMEAAAGFGNNNFAIKEEDVKGRYIVPDFNGIDFMITIKGNSMETKYLSGDIVACRILKEKTFIQWNKAYIVGTKEQGILCKRLLESNKENHLKAVSDNKEFPAFDIPLKEITGLALIIGIIRLE